MAEIVFGVGCSHSPLLATKPEDWDFRANDDRNNPAHPFRGGVYTFQELVSLRKDEDLAKQIDLDVRRERDARNQKHLALLGEKIKAAQLPACGTNAPGPSLWSTLTTRNDHGRQRFRSLT